jgi:hypothetical protein
VLNLNDLDRVSNTVFVNGESLLRG